jgi:hypothetical protein
VHVVLLVTRLLRVRWRDSRRHQHERHESVWEVRHRWILWRHESVGEAAAGRPVAVVRRRCKYRGIYRMDHGSACSACFWPQL